jgi:hypothetical protein
MARFRCPECGRERDIAPGRGGEIVSVYCLEHAGSADFHIRPVYMTLIEAPARTKPRRERVLA